MAVKTLRSFIHEKIPLDLRVDLDILSRRRDLRGEEKQEEIIKLFRKYEIENISQLGPGTNRYGLKLDGFVIKVATDNDGKIDNLKEFKMAKLLFPRVPKTYEVSENGSLLIAEYVQPFDSFTEMSRKADKIRAILTELSAVCLIGDVGITSKNYANWGIRVGTDEVVCLDFAYIYDVTSDLFICRHCHMNATLVPNKDFTKLICPNPACGKETLFEDIRAMIPNDYHRQQIGDLSKEGYLMTSSNVLTELTESRSNYLVKMKKKSKTAPKQKDEIDYGLVNDKEDKEMSQENILTANAVVSQLPPHPFQGLVIPATSFIAGQEPPENNSADADQVKISSVEDDSAVVFSAEIDPNTKIEVVDAYEEEPVAAEETEQAVVAQSDANVVEEKKRKLFSDNFIANSHKAISIMSNRITLHLRYVNLLDGIKDMLVNKNKRFYPEEFYAPLQNAIFKSMVEFFQFEEHDVPNPSGDGGTHKEYHAVDEIVNADDFPAAESLKFIERVYNTRKVNSAETETELLEMYKSIYPDGIMLQPELIQMIVDRLGQKVELKHLVPSIIISTISKYWGTVKADDESDSVTIAEEAAMQAMADDETVDISGSYEIQDNEGDKYEEDPKEDEGEYEEENTRKYMSISIFPEDGIDVIRVETDDAFGDINIPVYANFDKVDPTDYSRNFTDKRNGVWDWLTHTAPDMMFRTNDPQKYLDMNDEDMDEWQCHMVILEAEDDDGNCIMGIYMVAGIYIIDAEYNSIPTFDGDLLARMNIVLNDVIGGKYTSHRKYSVQATSLIHDEEYIQQFICNDDEEDPDSDDADSDTEDDSISEEEDEVVIDRSSEPEEAPVDAAVQAITEMEEAAMQAMADDETVDADEEHEVVEEPVQVNNSGKKRDARGRFVKQDQSDDEDGTITPRRRQRK